MTSSEERMEILRMVEEGKITASEGAELLRALESVDRTRASEPLKGISKPRWFRVRVTDASTGRKKVDVNIPMGLVNVGIKMGAKFAPEIDGTQYETIMDAIRNGQQGKIIDVIDEEDGEHVEIFVE
ncbi:MAG: SHOCT-like domain-containing protein [Candidatus Promineifilaceae bacterium]